MATKLLWFASVLLLTMPGTVAAQSVLGERDEICEDREVLIWGRSEDHRLFRGDDISVSVSRNEPVVWFCGRKRFELYCPGSDRVNRIDVSWEKNGVLRFECLG